MKIVVHGTNWIGDAVMTIPAMRELRRIFPVAEITLYTRPWAKGIFRDSGFVDDILCPDDSTLKRRLTPEISIWKNRGFDIAVVFPNSFRAALISKLGGAKKRYGYSGEGRGMLLTKAIPKPVWKNEKHEIYYYLNLVSEVERFVLGTSTASDHVPATELSVSVKRKELAAKLLKDEGLDPTKPTIGLGVGSQNSRAKRWMPENYAMLNDQLQKKFDANVLIMGSENENETAEIVASQSNLKPIILTGKTKLDEAVAVLSEIDLFVSNDMGLAHISAAVGTKTLTIFGPTNPLTTRPWNGEIIKRDDIDCAPCMLRDCPIDHRCMTRIEVDDVFHKVAQMLAVDQP